MKKFDIFIFLLQVSYIVTMTKVLTLDFIPINSTITLTVIMVIAYRYRFGLRNSFGNVVKGSYILVIYFLIYIFDILQCMFVDLPSAIVRGFACINMFVFMAYMYNIIFNQVGKDRDIICSIQKTSRPYLYFSLYNVVIVIVAALLIGLGIISATDNEIPVNSITKTDVESGQAYYFPKYISIVTRSMRIFANWGIPMITGLSHEPHVLNYFIMPSLYLILSIKKCRKYKIVFIMLYAVVLLFATSTTAVLCFALMFIIDVIWSFSINKKLQNFAPLLLFVIIVISHGQMFLDLLENEFIRKTVEDTGSMSYSQNVLNYILSPSSLFGEGNMPREFGYTMTKGNVGMVTFSLDVTFFFLLLFTSLKLCISRDDSIHYIGLSALYIVLHSLKICIHIYSYPMFSFIILILVLTNNVSHNKKQILQQT